MSGIWIVSGRADVLPDGVTKNCPVESSQWTRNL